MGSKNISFWIISGVMIFSFRREFNVISVNEDVLQPPNAPSLGSGDYASSMVGTIGEVVREHDLHGKSVAVWGGSLANAHDMPFLYRVAADWFLLPEKPVPVVATAEEASKYEYILSPWDSAYALKTDQFQVEQLEDRDFVRLYRLKKIKEAEE